MIELPSISIGADFQRKASLWESSDLARRRATIIVHTLMCRSLDAAQRQASSSPRAMQHGHPSPARPQPLCGCCEQSTTEAHFETISMTSWTGWTTRFTGGIADKYKMAAEDMLSELNDKEARAKAKLQDIKVERHALEEKASWFDYLSKRVTELVEAVDSLENRRSRIEASDQLDLDPRVESAEDQVKHWKGQRDVAEREPPPRLPDPPG
ncbi:unnamed protein product, partial [Prorocentrum cordatum]